MTTKLLKESEVKVHHSYYAKHPKNMIFGNDDRLVLWISEDRRNVQYDSATIRDGRKYPVVTMEAFLKWAAGEREVIDK